jgi:WD40 repeat protein
MQQVKALASGRQITLQHKIASSGEGTVWKTDFAGYLAKLYHSPTPDRIEKLKVMVAAPPTNPMRQQQHMTFAWPQDLLVNSQGRCLGFLMPEIVDGAKVSMIYNPRLRRRKAPRFNWYYLHTAALNFALALKSLHDEGYVVGDIKPQNLLVNSRALISVIDTDSFQVRDSRSQQVYRCLVGSEGFTPPELLGQELSQLDQSEIHDRFRLGVMVYMLLFGDQPFKGKWIGRGESPQPADLIRTGHWPYAPNSLVQPGPNTIPLAIVHPQLQVCFQRCFTEGHRNPQARPSAQDWIDALRVAIPELQVCTTESNHHYSHTYGRCYWCDRKTSLSVDIFSPKPPANRPRATPRRPAPSRPRGLPIGAGVGAMSPSAASLLGAPMGQSLQGLGSTAQQVTNSIWSSTLSRWSHPVAWGTACIVSGLVGLILLLLPDLNFQAITNVTDSLESTLAGWVRGTIREVKSQRPPVTLAASSPPYRNAKGELIQHGGHSDAVTTLAFSADGKRLISGSKDTTVKVWDFPSGKVLHTLTENLEPVLFVGVSNDFQRLVAASATGRVMVWNLGNMTLSRSLMTNTNWGSEGSIRSAAIDRKGELVASSAWSDGILLHSLQTGKILRIPSGVTASEQALAIFPSGKTVLSSTGDGTFRIWDSQSGKLLKSFPSSPSWEPWEPTNTMMLSANGQWAAVGGWFGSVSLWDAETGQLLRRFPKQATAVTAIAISPKGSHLATVTEDDTIIYLWDPRTGISLGSLTGHTGRVKTIAFSQDGKTLVSGGEDQSIRVWNLKTLQLDKALVL